MLHKQKDSELLERYSFARRMIRLQVVGKIILFLVTIHVFLFAPEVFAQTKRNILILNSYHQGYKWTDDITHGILSALAPESANTRIFIEYMGTKWVKGKAYFQELRKLMKLKFSKTHFDLIISSDNDAFNFLCDCRDELFGKIPSVFCGVNYLNASELAGIELYTGISEIADIKGSLELALKLHPLTKRILIVGDSTISGRRVRDEINRVIPSFGGRVQFDFEPDKDLDGIVKDVARLSKNTLIFYTFYVRDASGRFYEFDESISRISRNARVPVYGAWDFNLGLGMVGGKLISGFDQGAGAGQMALRILRGEKVGKIPVALKARSRFMFDYKQMARFGIKESALPQGSIVINGPKTFRMVPNRVIWMVVTGVAALGFLTILLFHFNRRRKQSEDLLRKAHDRLEVIVADRTRDLTELNERLRDDIESRRRTEEELKRTNRELTREVEARKSAEEASLQSVSLLRATLESTDDGILVVDKIGRIVDWNKRFLELWCIPDTLISSRSDEEALAYVLEQLLCPDEFLEKVRELYDQPEEESIDTLRFKDGRIFERYSRPQYLNRQIVGRVWSFRDITERKKMEEEILKAQKLESLGILAGGIAHDFNNLVTGIMGNISLAKMSVAPGEKVRIRLEEAEKACNQTRGLTGQLLTFAKGGAPVKKLDSISRIIMDSAEFVLRGSNVRCEFHLPEDLWSVEVDSGQMSQVINNLIINADQAMPDGGVVSVSAENSFLAPDSLVPLQQGKYVHILIRDQGSGISEENLTKIFDPYFTTRKSGSGLGLTSVYSIITKHDGHVSVESISGNGTTFHLYLPALEECFTKDTNLPKVPENQSGRGNILILDDEIVVRHTARDMLEHLGYQVDLCEDGTDALRLYQDGMESGRPYTVVFMDLTIPGGMGGKATMKKLLEIDPEVKGVVTSGYSNDPILAYYREYGFCGVVEKPFSFDALMEVLERVQT
jgi:PAS domain S-box-containing protein